jgi:hypothetical protein
MPSGTAPLSERDAAVILIATAKSKGLDFSPMNQDVSRRVFFQKERATRLIRIH